MDRPIDVTELRSRRRRRFLTGLIVVILLASGTLVVGRWIKPSVRRTRIRTAVVARGPVEETIAARGTVVPEYEHVIACPIDTRVIRILKPVGATVAAGEPIVELDVSATELELAKLEDQIALQENASREAAVELERTLDELSGHREIQELDVQTCQYRAQRDRQLFELGVFSEDQARTSESEAARAVIALRQIDASIANAREVQAVRLQSLDLEIGLLQREREEVARRLRLASPASDRAGVVTWIVSSEGSAVRKGDELIRIADLRSFRVEANLADVHANRLARDERVRISAGEETLYGTVANILPTVEDGVVGFEVDLDEPGHPVLRHNLRVDVQVITHRKEDAIYVKRGAYLMADGSQAVFVIHGDRAVRTPVQFGITNLETYEVLSGLEPGDQVITSDMRDHRRAKEVRLR